MTVYANRRRIHGARGRRLMCQPRLRHHLKPTNKSWRVDETYIRVKGRWCYLYRAIDSTGATIDFLLSVVRDAAAAKRLQGRSADPRHARVNPVRIADCDRRCAIVRT